MVFKVLCFALLACTLVQAAPQWNPADFLRNVGKSLSTSAQKNVDSFKEEMDAKLKAVQSGFETGAQALETKGTIIMTIPRIIGGMFEKDSKLDADHLKKVVGDVLDKNAESKKALAESVIDTTQALGNLAKAKGNATWDFLTLGSRVAATMVENAKKGE